MSGANLLAGILGYVFQVLMGRLLTPGEFALFSAILALSMFLSSPLVALFMIVSRRVSLAFVSDGEAVLKSIYFGLLRNMTCGVLLFLILFFIFFSYLSEWLRAGDSKDVWLLGFILVGSAFVVLNAAFFQGKKLFSKLATVSVAGVVFKIIFSVVLIYLGFGVSGALLGVVLSLAIIWIYGVFYFNRSLSLKEAKNYSPLATYPLQLFPVLVANLSFIAMTQLDMVMVNHFFDMDTAGIYAAASVLGKAVLYIPAGFVAALFPFVAERQAKNERSGHLLMIVIVLTLLTCGFAALLYIFFANEIIDMFYGPEYADAADLLTWYGILILPMALVMVAQHFLIAKGRVAFSWVFLFFACFQVGAFAIWHDNLWTIIAILGIGGSLLCLVVYLLIWFESGYLGFPRFGDTP